MAKAGFLHARKRCLSIAERSGLAWFGNAAYATPASTVRKPTAAVIRKLREKRMLSKTPAGGLEPSPQGWSVLTRQGRRRRLCFDEFLRRLNGGPHV
jgi:hypothetical protein